MTAATPKAAAATASAQIVVIYLLSYLSTSMRLDGVTRIVNFSSLNFLRALLIIILFFCK